MPFEKGNKLGANSKEFQKRMRAAIEQDNWERVRRGIESVLDLAATGERWALELVRDTLDGRPAQSLVAHDDEGREVAIALITYSDSIQVQPAPLSITDTSGTGRPH